MFSRVFVSRCDEEFHRTGFQNEINRWFLLGSLFHLEVKFVEYTGMSDGRLSVLIIYSADKEIQ
jgi:hypothetical protein